MSVVFCRFNRSINRQMRSIEIVKRKTYPCGKGKKISAEDDFDLQRFKLNKKTLAIANKSRAKQSNEGTPSPLPYVQVIRQTLKFLKNLFRLQGIFLPNLRILSRKNNEPTLFIPFCNDCDHKYIVQTKRQFGTSLKEHHLRKENSAQSEHTCLTNHTIRWDKSKIITTNRRYHQRLCLILSLTLKLTGVKTKMSFELHKKIKVVITCDLLIFNELSLVW